MTIETKYNVGDKVWVKQRLGFISFGILSSIAYREYDGELQVLYMLNNDEYSITESQVNPDIEGLKTQFFKDAEDAWLRIMEPINEIVQQQEKVNELADEQPRESAKLNSFCGMRGCPQQGHHCHTTSEIRAYDGMNND